MKPEAKKKLKDNAPSIGAIIVALATAVGGLAECEINRTKSQNSENIRVASDEALLAELEQIRAFNAQYQEFADGVGTELDELHDENVACQEDVVELEIRVGVLERLGPDGGVVREALVEELLRLAEEEGAPLEASAEVAENVTPEDKAEEVAAKVVKKKAKKPKFEFAPPDAPAAAQDLDKLIQQKAW